MGIHLTPLPKLSASSEEFVGDFDRGSIPEPSLTRCQIESVVIVDLAGSLSFFRSQFSWSWLWRLGWLSR